MDGESGELTDWENVVGAWTGKSKTEGPEWGWRRELGSWFQRHGEAYLKKRWVIRNEDDVGGRARVTRDEQRVLRGGWTKMRLRSRYAWVVVTVPYIYNTTSKKLLNAILKISEKIAISQERFDRLPRNFAQRFVMNRFGQPAKSIRWSLLLYKISWKSMQ